MDAGSTSSRADLALFMSCFASRCPITGRIEVISKEFDLAPGEAVTIVTLASEPSTVSGIARAIGMRQNSASILIDRLVARGLVRRRRRSGDQRVVDITLTDAGRSVAAELLPALEAQAGDLLSCLSTSELEGLVSLHERAAMA